MSLKANWRLRPFWVLLVVLVFVVGGKAYQLSQRDVERTPQEAAVKPPSQDFPREWSKRVIETDEGTIVEYRMNNVVFRFPKAIVVQDREGLGAVVLPKWPTMEWAHSIANLDMIDVGFRFRQLPLRRERLVQLGKRDANMQFVEAPDAPGLLVYEPPISGWAGAYYLSTDPDLTDTNGDPLLYSCGAGIFVPYRECTVWFQVAPGVGMKYRFYDKNLADWNEIHRALMAYITVEEE